MSRFLRSAALAAAAAGGLSLLITSSPFPLLGFASATSSTPPRSPNPDAVTTGTGHLALVRAHPDLKDLNAMLSPGGFLIDATQVFLVCALRHAPPLHTGALRGFRDQSAAQILSAESEGDAEQEAWARLRLAILDARDGDHERALEALTRLAADHPGRTTPHLHILAAALCHMLGRPEEGTRWLREGGVRDLSHGEHKRLFLETVMNVSQGYTPRVVVAAGSDELVLLMLHGLLEFSLGARFRDGDLSERLQVLALMGFLRDVWRGSYAAGMMHHHTWSDLRTPRHPKLPR